MAASDAAYLGQISMYAFTFSPVNWMSCNGGLVPVAQNTGMASLLGTHFGGDGVKSFALPNMTSRAPIGQFSGGSTNDQPMYDMGKTVGAQWKKLTLDNLPPHTHDATFNPRLHRAEASLEVYETGADKAIPSAGDLIAASGNERFRSPGGFGDPAKVRLGGISAKEGAFTGTVKVDETGGGAPFEIQSPALAVNFSICANGDWPNRY